MKYAIITNPVSGRLSADQKRSALAEAAEILGAEIHGLDTVTADDLGQCAREVVNRCDVLVVAGGDGTLSDIINSIDAAETPIAFLPLGTGNAIRHALGYKGSLTDIATRIRDGKIHEYDLIECSQNKRAFMGSIGFEGTTIRLRQRYLAQGSGGLRAYLAAIFDAYFREYKRVVAKITVDGATFEVNNLLSLMIVKQPYYGYGLKVVPRAQFNDGQLHMVCVNSGLFICAVGAISAFTIGSRIGQYRTGQQVTVKLQQPLLLQLDGNIAWEADRFAFTVLPNALKIKC